MFQWVLNWLAGGVIGQFTRPLLKAYEIKEAAKTSTDKLVADIAVKDIEATIQSRRVAKGIRLATAGFWEMRLAVGIISVSTALHYAAIVADSVFLFSWDIAKLPAPFDEYEGSIILSFFGLQAVTGLSNVLVRRFAGGK